MTREEIVEGLKLLEDNMVHFDELQNDRGEWIDVHELLFEAIKALEQQPSDTVSRGAFEQVMWERDVAIEQLKELGYELGQKIEHCDDAISRNAVIQTLNKMDRYTATELTLCDTNKKFPANEVFIVDDVYEQIAEQLPSVTHKPIECDDAISREAVIEWLKAKDIIKLSSQEETARKELKALPPVTPQKYGHWIWNFDKGYCKCSECGIGMGHKEFDYCPNCGAKMQESEDKE